MNERCGMLSEEVLTRCCLGGADDAARKCTSVSFAAIRVRQELNTRPARWSGWLSPFSSSLGVGWDAVVFLSA
jgi:hypothetical protein